MNDEQPPSPQTLPARLKAAWRRWRAAANERRALEDIAGKPNAHLLEDAGLTRDDALHLLQQRRLHAIADRCRLRGRGL